MQRIKIILIRKFFINKNKNMTDIAEEMQKVNIYSSVHSLCILNKIFYTYNLLTKHNQILTLGR